MNQSKESKNPTVPIIDMPKILEGAVEKQLTSTFKAIKNFCSGDNYSLKLELQKIDPDEGDSTLDFPIELKKVDENNIEFEITLRELPGVSGVLYKESYGLNNELKIMNSIEELHVKPGSVVNFSTEFPKIPQILKGQFTQINSISNSDYREDYFRLVIFSKDKEFRSPLSILERNLTIISDSDSHNSHRSIMGIYFRSGIGCSKLSVNGKHYHYYSVEDSTVIIDCLDKTDLTTFKLDTQSIKLAFAFLSGNLYEECKYYLSSSNINFSEINGVWYEKGPTEITSSNQIINPTLFFGQYEKKNQTTQDEWKQYHKAFDSGIFSRICEKIIDSRQFKRCLELLTSASSIDDPVQKGALYSVCIETLADLIGSENEDSFQPIPKDKKKIWKQLRTEMNEALDKIKETIDSHGYTILKTKIDNLNSPTNRDKLEKPFKFLGINLNEDELDTLNQRNRYLHGDKPEDNDWTTATQLNALKLHYLIGMLVLKYFQYSGYYMNVAALYLLGDRDTQKLISKIDFEELEMVMNKVNKGEIESKEELERANEVIQNFQRFNIAASEIQNLITII